MKEILQIERQTTYARSQSAERSGRAGLTCRKHKLSTAEKGEIILVRLLAACCNCGRIIGRSADGTQTGLRCPKCGAELEYIVGDNAVTVRLIRQSAKQQAARLRKYSDRRIQRGSD